MTKEEIANVDVQKTFVMLKKYFFETKMFLESVLDAVMAKSVDCLESEASDKTSVLFKEVTDRLRMNWDYFSALHRKFSDSKEPLQTDFLLNEFQRNVALVKSQRERFILETVPMLLGVPGASVNSLQSMESQFWDAKVMYDELVERGLKEQDAKCCQEAWNKAQNNWEKLKKTYEIVRDGILQNRYSITHLKLLLAYLVQSGNKMAAIRTSLGEAIFEILMKDVDRLANLENGTGPISLEKAFYHHATRSYLSFKEKALVDLERLKVGEVISMQKLFFSLEMMLMTLIDLSLVKSDNNPSGCSYQPGEFLKNHQIGKEQVVDMLRNENDVIISCVMDYMTTLKKTADTLHTFNSETRRKLSEQLVCAEDYLKTLLTELNHKSALLCKDCVLENVTLQTVWEEKLRKHEIIKKLDRFVFAACDATERNLSTATTGDKDLTMSTLSRSIPIIFCSKCVDRDSERWCLSEEFILGIVKEHLTSGKEGGVKKKLPSRIPVLVSRYRSATTANAPKKELGGSLLSRIRSRLPVLTKTTNKKFNKNSP